MGFGKNSRKEAQAQQKAAMKLQQDAYNRAQAQTAEYQSNFSTRNAPIIGLQQGAQKWLQRYEKGEDVASLNPAFARHAQESADAVKNTMAFAGKLGDTAGKGDADYQAKLRSVSERNISKGLAGMNMQALEGELGNQRGILMDTSNFLNADARAGLGMNAQLFDMTNSIFQNATTRRQMEMQRSNMMMNNLMSAISGGATGLLTAFGVGGYGGGGS